MKNNMINTTNPFGLIDPFFDEFFSSESNSQFKQMMATDIKDNNDHYELKIDMPDIKKEDIKLSLDNGYLTIEATSPLRPEHLPSVPESNSIRNGFSTDRILSSADRLR